MLRPRCYITITKDDGTNAVFDFVHELETDESYEHLTDTANVILPRKLTQSGLPLFTGENPIFKRKDRITIEAGYFPNRQLIFDGFISHVSANIPVQLECENYMFLFKLFKVTYPKTVTTRTVSKRGKPLKHPKVTSVNITLSELMGNIWHELEYNDLDEGLSYEVVDNIALGNSGLRMPPLLKSSMSSETLMVSVLISLVRNFTSASPITLLQPQKRNL
jgi:hypothetical protein